MSKVGQRAQVWENPEKVRTLLRRCRKLREQQGMDIGESCGVMTMWVIEATGGMTEEDLVGLDIGVGGEALGQGPGIWYLPW